MDEIPSGSRHGDNFFRKKQGGLALLSYSVNHEESRKNHGLVLIVRAAIFVFKSSPVGARLRSVADSERVCGESSSGNRHDQEGGCG